MLARAVEPRDALDLERVRLVRNYVRRHYEYPSVDLDDLVQEALIGVLKADRKRPGVFDHEPKLLWCVVRGAVADYLRKYGEVTQRGRVRLKLAGSLDAPMNVARGRDGERRSVTWGETLVDSTTLPAGDLADRVGQALDVLPRRERSIVTLTVVHGYHQHELGEQMGVSEARVGQIRQRGLKRMARDPGLMEWAEAA